MSFCKIVPLAVALSVASSFSIAGVSSANAIPSAQIKSMASPASDSIKGNLIGAAKPWHKVELSNGASLMDTYSDKYIFGENTVTNDTELTTSGYRVASSVIYSDDKELSMDKFIYSSEDLQLSMTGSKLSFWSTNSVNYDELIKPKEISNSDFIGKKMVILKPTSEDNPGLWGIEFKKQGEAYIDAQRLSYVGHWKVERVGDEVMGYDVLQISGLDSINDMSLMIVESSNDVYVSADLQQSGRYLLLSGDRDLNYILGSKVVSF